MTEIEFEVWQNGEIAAGGTATNAKDALREADHYALVYGQDGPVEVKFFIRQSATREELERFAEHHEEMETMKKHPQSCYADDGSPIKCPKCGHAEFTEKMRGFIDFGVGAGPATEIEYFCGSCGESVAYWAYGSFDPAYLNHE